MTNDDFVDALAARAREAKAPDVDVVDRVLRTLAEPEGTARSGIDPLVWVAGVSVLGAAAVAFLSASAWGMLTDPMVPTLLDVMGAIG